MIITSRAFWAVAVFILSFTIILILYRQFFFEKGHLIHKIMLGLYAMYLGTLFVLILFPTYMLRPFRFTTANVNLIPFKSFHSFLTNPKEPIGNILLFMPFGFFSVLNDRVKAGRRLLNVLWRTAVISALMETLQMFIGRIPDIDDVIINTIGGVIGGAACVAWHKTRMDHTALGAKIMPELPKRWRGKMAIPLLSVVTLICYGGGLICANAAVTRTTMREYNVEINGVKQHFSLEAENALLWDSASETSLFEESATNAIYPAATMMLVTCLTAVDIADPDEEVKVGDEILRVPFDCSRADICMGTTYTVRELLAGILLPSGADACYALAAYCGRRLLNDSDVTDQKALDAFIEAGNKKLKSLGASNTTMINVEGLDEDGQLTTVQDLCKIASAVLDNPILSQICSTAEMEIGPDDDRIQLKNTNLLIRSDSDLFTEDFVGIKTGSTSLAGNCLIGAFKRNGNQYVTIVMHSGYEGKFSDTQTLAKLVA